MLTLDQAKSLTHGQIIYHVAARNADGTPQRWRVSGKVKTWKRSPERVEVPLKHGLYWHQHLTEGNLVSFCLTEDEAIKAPEPDWCSFCGEFTDHNSGKHFPR